METKKISVKEYIEFIKTNKDNWFDEYNKNSVMESVIINKVGFDHREVNDEIKLKLNDMPHASVDQLIRRLEEDIKVTLLRNNPDYQTTVHSVGGGQWTIEVSSPATGFLFELVGSNGTHGESDDLYELLAMQRKQI